MPITPDNYPSHYRSEPQMNMLVTALKGYDRRAKAFRNHAGDDFL
jgi:hypothetical protein